ncbi:MAG: DUF4440 domain-containing protein [Cyanobacteria bacterium P01_E01_bin.6]
MSETKIILSVFTSYAKEFEQMDPDLLVKYFHQPAALVTQEKTEFMNKEEDIKETFDELFRYLKSNNFSHSSLSSLSVKQVSSSQAIITGRAIRFKKDGDELERFGLNYTMQKKENDWKIIFGLLHEYYQFILCEGFVLPG